MWIISGLKIMVGVFILAFAFFILLAIFAKALKEVLEFIEGVNK